jgi:hypothetical protein
MTDIELEDIVSGIEKPSRKKYLTLQIESEEATEFKKLAKDNGITQTMLLRYLIESTRELQEIKKSKG